MNPCINITDIAGENLVRCGSSKMVKADESTDYLPLCIDCRITKYNRIRFNKQKFFLANLEKDGHVQQPEPTTWVYCIELPTGNLKFGETTKLYDRLTKLHRDFGLRTDQRLKVIGLRRATVASEASIHDILSEHRRWNLLGEQFEANEDTYEFAEVMGFADAEDLNRYLTDYSPKKDAVIEVEMNPDR